VKNDRSVGSVNWRRDRPVGVVQPDDGVKHTAESGSDVEFDEALNACIALALLGKDFVVNGTLACLVTVKEVLDLWGLKAARQAVAIFLSVGVTLVIGAWLVNDAHKSASDALVTAFGSVSLPVLLYLLSRGDRK
jgi:hypothetical protein